MRERTRERNQKETPNEFPLGSAVYKKGTGHLNSDKGLIGHTYKKEDAFPAWQYLGHGEHRFLGTFATHEAAMRELSKTY